MATAVEANDMKLLVMALKAIAGETVKEPKALAASSYRYLRGDIPPGEAIGPTRLAFFADLLGVDVQVMAKAEAEFLAQFPRFGLQPGDPGFSARRNRKPDVIRLIRQETSKTTITSSRQAAARHEQLGTSSRVDKRGWRNSAFYFLLEPTISSPGGARASRGEGAQAMRRGPDSQLKEVHRRVSISGQPRVGEAG